MTNTKKVIILPLFFLTLIMTIFSSDIVHAETYAGEAIWPSEFIPNVYIRKLKSDGTGKYQQAKFIRRSEDNAFVYCLQPFVDINNNNVYNVARSDYETYLNMSETQWNRISLLAYYGYGYANHTDAKWYAITQILIWRTAEPTSTFYFTDTLNGTRDDSIFASEIQELENLVANHYKAPKFEQSQITLPLGSTITLNDSNGVLNNFNISSQTNVNATINNNSITLTATGIGDAKIKLTKTDTKYSMPPIVYFKEGTQNVFRVGSYDPVSVSINMKVIGGRVEITKRDKNSGEIIPEGLGKLSNATYGIYNAETDELISQITTDDNAYAISDYLPNVGNFYLKEIKASEGYKLDNQKYFFTIDENNLLVTMDVYEEIITRDFKFTKVYASDKTQIMTPEVGVEFGIYDHNNNLISRQKSDLEGKIYFTLPYGNYTLRQLTSTSNYEKIEDYYFEVREEGPSVNKVLSNAEITSRVKVVKVDEEGNTIYKSGIKFKIKDLSTGEYVCQKVSYPVNTTYCEYETSSTGILITPYPLNSGNYQLEEVDQIIEGYVWNNEPLKFSINEDSNIISSDGFDNILEIKFTNKEVKGTIEINKTGEKLVIEDGNYTYEKIPLQNVIYEVRNESGEVVGTIRTDENGYGKLENLKLQKYTLKEIASSNNNLLDPTEYEFELIYKDQYTEVITKTFTLKNYLGKGTIDFTKLDISTSNPLPNTLIEIYKVDTEELIFSNYTDDKGKIVIDNLPYGKYYILEKKAPDGYILNEEKMYFEILENGEIVKITMTNDKIKGTLEFTKTDISTSEPLPNTLIEVYKADTEELIFSGYTDESGKILIKNIEYGKYYLLEKEAPDGYILNEEKMYFEIKENGEIVKANMTNEKITSVVGIHKVDENGNPIKGVTIGIYDLSGNLIYSDITNESGDIEFTLEYGSYYFQEISTLDQFELSNEKVYFDVTENGEYIQKTLVNELKEIEVPNTSSNTYIDVVAGTIVLLGAGLIIISSKRKKK